MNNFNIENNNNKEKLLLNNENLALNIEELENKLSDKNKQEQIYKIKYDQL
jgi:hypothetical protein